MKKTEQLAGDYLLFTDGHGQFALPSSCVQEILYPHAVTPLPFVPLCIDGLINVEGNIAVQVNFAELTGQNAHSSGKELILINTGRARCALKVDGVIGRIVLQENAIQPFNPAAQAEAHTGITQIEQELLCGEAVYENQGIFIVDYLRIGRLVQAGTVVDEGVGMLGKVDDHNRLEEQEYIACLVVRTGNERYTFELNGIMEIIEAGICTPIPGAPDYLKGFHLVRDTALLIIDLPTIIGHRQLNTQDAGWIIVIERDGIRYGFLVEQIEGIEHFPLNSYQPLFDTNSHLSGLFVYNDMTTMLLSPDRIVSKEVFEVLSRYAAYHADEEELLVEQTERYLQVRICDGRYAIPIDYVKRVTQFFPMEKTHDSSGRIRGAIDIDGRIIPVLALETALTLSEFVEQGEYVIVGSHQEEWAICVDTAHRIVDIPVSQISRMSQGDSRFVNGIAHVDEQLVSLLDFSLLHNHSETNMRTTP